MGGARKGGGIVNGYFHERLHEIGQGDHVCLVYEDVMEQVAAVVPYVKLGLERRERCLYVADDNAIGEVTRYLHNAGVDVGLVGRAAGRTRPCLADDYPHLSVVELPHPSPMFVNRSVENRRAVLDCLRRVKALLDRSDLPH